MRPVSTRTLSAVAAHFVGEPVQVLLGGLPSGYDGLAEYPDSGRVIRLAHGMAGETLLRVFSHELGHHVLDHPGKPSNRHLVMWSGDPDDMQAAAKQGNAQAARAQRKYDRNEIEADLWVEQNIDRVKQAIEVFDAVRNEFERAGVIR